MLTDRLYTHEKSVEMVQTLTSVTQRGNPALSAAPAKLPRVARAMSHICRMWHVQVCRAAGCGMRLAGARAVSRAPSDSVHRCAVLAVREMLCLYIPCTAEKEGGQEL